jgi:uncharacterized protein YdhG (YjbR/CyaY superfamily)
VDEYIALAPKEVQDKLKEFRATIKTAAPSAQERISYGMPYYYYKGRLVYFGISKKHIGLYIPTPVLEEHKSELKGYGTTKATVRFPLDKKLPVMLIKKLKVRVKKNDETEKKRKEKITCPNSDDASRATFYRSSNRREYLLYDY